MPTTAPAARNSTAQRRRKTSSARRDDEAPIIPILARKVREVEAKAQRGKLGPTNRVKFQVIAFLVREERARVKADTTLTDAARAELLKRLDGVATILAKTAARDTSLIQLLEVDQAASPVARRMRRDWLLESGAELAPDELIITDVAPAVDDRSCRPLSPSARSCRRRSSRASSRTRSSPPDLRLRAPKATPRRRLDGWELMGPLYKAFEMGAGGASASMDLPPVPEFDRLSPKGLEVMPHQSRFLEAVRDGHRTFLLADEPGLGKTAESVLAASVADAYPLLAVVPNVVKMNWAREVERWTPQRRATVIHGDGENIDAFADVFIVNYEILDRHLSWLGSLGLKGMVVDEAHFIKNLTSQRSQNVLALAARIREQVRDPLLLALTGTPLINDVEDFDAIWRFLGWTTGEKPGPVLMERLDETGLTPADKAFYPEARDAVISMGIVRRKKKDVAADLPDKLIADLPVELDDEFGRSIRRPSASSASGSPRATAASSRRAALAALAPGEVDADIVRLVAQNELDESKAAGTGSENVFTMVRKIGQAKALLAADYTVQLQRSVGKVVFFAKHIDVMDAAEAHFAAAGLRTDLDPRRPDHPGSPARDRRVQQRPRRRHRGVLADRGRRRPEHAGGVERRARRAVVDGRRADAGDRPRAPHRPGRAGHGVAHHRRAHDRHQDRRADRLEAGPRGPRARRRGRRSAVERLGAAVGAHAPACGGRSARTERSARGCRGAIGRRVAGLRHPALVSGEAASPASEAPDSKDHSMKIGILTSGGDCPGLNAVIRGVVLKGTTTYDLEFVGIRDGWRGVVDADFFPLTRHEVKGLSKVGGTILGTSRTNPYEGPRGGAENIAKTLYGHRIDGIIAIGGEGTLAAANRLANDGINVIGVPKTIDNDLRATDYSFGFDTAVNIATDAMDRLRTTGDSHQRCMVAEVMGRHVGWIALHAGMAAGAHAICIPEVPMSIDEITRARHAGARPRPRAARRRLRGLHAHRHGRGLQRQGPRRLQPSAPRRHQRGARARDRAHHRHRDPRHGARPHPARRLAVRLRPRARDAPRPAHRRRGRRRRLGSDGRACAAPTSCACRSPRRSASSTPCRATATTRPRRSSAEPRGRAALIAALARRHRAKRQPTGRRAERRETEPPAAARASGVGEAEHVEQPGELERPLLPRVVAAAHAAVAGDHLALEQRVRADLAQPRDPLRRLDVQHAGVVQRGDGEDARVRDIRPHVLVRRVRLHVGVHVGVVQRVAPLVPLDDGERQRRVEDRRERVDERHVGEDAGEQLRREVRDGAHQQAAGRAALGDQPVGRRVAAVDEVPGAVDEVGEGVALAAASCRPRTTGGPSRRRRARGRRRRSRRGRAPTGAATEKPGSIECSYEP